MNMSRPVLDRSQTNGSSISNFASIPQILEIPNLIAIQTESFKWLKSEGIKQVLDGISPLADFTGTKYELSFYDHRFDPPKRSEAECKEDERTYSAPMYVKSRLVMKETGEIKEQDLFMGDLPLMTKHGTFIINGAERVVVSQLVRSPGAYFTADRDLNSNRIMCNAKLIPYRGAWLEFETSTKNVISVKIDRKRKISVTTLLVSLGVDMDAATGKLFSEVDTDPAHQYMQETAERDPLPETTSVSLKERDLKIIWEVLCPSKTFDIRKAQTIGIAQLEVYRRLRPGEPPNLDNAWGLIKNLFYDERRYDIAKVGRYKLNTKLGLDIPMETRTLTLEDLFAVIKMIIRINNGGGEVDDIDNLGNRRVRAVGELIQKQLQVGLLRMERMVRERMTLIDPELATPQALVNIRPVVASIREFFGGSQLSQFMDQTNPLAELTHKRRLSALGPGGLSRDRAGFDVRDVHFSHYGRICPIETPEGPNIGLLSSLATYARINELGFIESPYRQVKQAIHNDDEELKGRQLAEDVLDDNDKIIAKQGRVIRNKTLSELTNLAPRMIQVRPFVSPSQDDIIYLSADKESEYRITHANEPLDDHNQFINDRIEVRDGEKPALISIERVDLMDVSPMQIVSVSASLIPFLEHDDANRALMGSNYQRQAVPLLKPQAPLVATGIEDRVARDSGQVVIAETDGIVKSVTGKQITTSNSQNQDGDKVYELIKFSRTNQGTCLNQKPIVNKGQSIRKGQILADSSSTQEGHLALGQNLLVAFMSWEGYNSDDAIILSEDLVKNDRLTSLHIEKYQVGSRDTKQGPEEITRDIPHVGEENLEDLDEIGIIRIGAEVKPGDILVGKVTPKGETELTAEEKLLRAIFGEKSRDVRDTSLRIPNGEGGTVIQVKALNRLDNASDLSPGVNETVRVWVAQTRKISVGDKMSGRHGNKGVVARILPIEDMPFLPDGTPVDIILNPVGVPSRMNLGQVLETHLGWVAKNMKFRAFTPVFDGATDLDIEKGLAQVWLAQQAGALKEDGANGAHPIDIEKFSAWLHENGYNPETVLSDDGTEARRISLKISLNRVGINVDAMSKDEIWNKARALHIDGKIDSPIFGKTMLTDGRTGEKFDNPITVGEIYMMKLSHLVEDKIHARSTGPYSLITQQPLGGKAQFGGQRFGEMEVWALEAYSAAHNLQEMLTVKSDDVAGRVKTYEAIVKGEDVGDPGIPESFNVLLKELQSLGLSVQLINDDPPISDQKDGLLDTDDPSLIDENSLLIENSILGTNTLSINSEGAPDKALTDLESNNPLSNPTEAESEDNLQALNNAASEPDSEGTMPDSEGTISSPESAVLNDTNDSDGGAHK